MDKVDILYHTFKSDDMTDNDLGLLYNFDAQLYDYENHRHNEQVKEILNTRDIKADLSHLLNCPIEQIAFLDESLKPNIKYLYTGLHIINLNTYEVLNGRTADMKKYLEYKENEMVQDEPQKTDNQIISELEAKSVIPNYISKKFNPIKKEIAKEKVIKMVTVPTKYFACASAILLTASAVISLSSDELVNKYIASNRSIISDEKVRTDDNTGYYYLHNNIAKNILKNNQDKDSLIYVVYNEVKRDASNINGHNNDQIDYNMDLIMRDLSFNSNEYDYSTFDDYLISKKCVDENGNVSTNAYDKMMHEYISNMLNNNEFTFDGGKSL